MERTTNTIENIMFKSEVEIHNFCDIKKELGTNYYLEFDKENELVVFGTNDGNYTEDQIIIHSYKPTEAETEYGEANQEFFDYIQKELENELKERCIDY